MAIRVKTGGAWHLIPAGGLYIRYAGAWKPAGSVYRKIGAVGGGYWYNTGYQGIPAIPLNLSGTFKSNPFPESSKMTLYWSEGVGGAPTTGYQILIRASPGGDTYYGPMVGTTITFALAAGTYYQFFIRAAADGGQFSPFAADPVQINVKP